MGSEIFFDLVIGFETFPSLILPHFFSFVSPSFMYSRLILFEAMGCYYKFCSCQEARPSLTDQDVERGNKKREMDDMRGEYIIENG